MSDKELTDALFAAAKKFDAVHVGERFVYFEGQWFRVPPDAKGEPGATAFHITGTSKPTIRLKKERKT